jgi:hypothetical protein
MTETPVRPDSEELRAFEELMQQQGAAAFAAGLAPWEDWEDAYNDLQWQHHGSAGYHAHATHHRKTARAQPPGQRLLAGVTRLMVLVLLVGIAGVYFSSRPTQQHMVQGIQPPPIALSDTHPATTGAREPAADVVASGVPDFEAYPAPAAGLVDRPAIEVVAKPPASPAGGDETVAAAAADAPPAVIASEPVATHAVTAASDPQPDAAPESGAWYPDSSAADEPPAAIASKPVNIQAVSPASDPPPAAAPEPGAWYPEPPVANAGTGNGWQADAGNPWQPAASGGDWWQPPAEPVAAATAQADVAEVIPDTDPGAGTGDTSAWQPASPQPEPVRTTVVEQTEMAPAREQPRSASVSSAAYISGTGIASVAAPADPAPAQSPADAASQAPAGSEDTHATGTRAANPAAADNSTPQWVVNLAAYNSENMASRMMEKFRAQGVETELFHITVNGKDMIRLRTTGLDSYQEAADWSTMLEERLALSGTWVSRR